MAAPLRTRAEANALAEARRRSEQDSLDRRRERNRQAWQRYHLEQAEAVLQTARELVAEHRRRARALTAEGEELS